MVEESPVGIEGFAEWEPPEVDVRFHNDMYEYKDPYEWDESSNSEDDHYYTWKHVRHVPASLSGWKGKEDKLEGDEEYGNCNDDAKAWALPFDGIPY